MCCTHTLMVHGLILLDTADDDVDFTSFAMVRPSSLSVPGAHRLVSITFLPTSAVRAAVARTRTTIWHRAATTMRARTRMQVEQTRSTTHALTTTATRVGVEIVSALRTENFGCRN